MPHASEPAALSARSLMDPQMAAAMDRMAEIAAELGDMPPMPTPPQVRARMLAERRFWNADPVPVAAVDDMSLDIGTRPVPLRAYRAETGAATPAVVYFHGGGWVKGSPDTHDRHARVLARETGATVFSVDYALAPEHKFPEPLEEAVAVIASLAGTADRWRIDAGHIALAGDSAGANLALAAAIDLRARHPRLVRSLALFYGVFGADLDTWSYRTFGGGEFGLSRADMAAYWAAYLRNDDDRSDPRAVPLRADLAGLPSVHLCAAGLDVLRDDTLALAQRLGETGVPFALERYEGVCHGFIGLGRMVDAADAAIAAAATFVRRSFG